MEKINPLKQIDFLFFYLKSFSHTDVKAGDMAIMKINKDEIQRLKISSIVYYEIMQQLTDDKLITMDSEGHRNCTFKGRIFPGYEITEKERTKSFHQAKANQIMILVLTAIMALGTFVAAIYYLKELCNSCY